MLMALLTNIKAMLVAKGFHQQQGFDFQETFSPVVNPVTVRIVLSITVSKKRFVKHIGINNAFLNGLTEEVYRQQPTGFGTSDKSQVCKLKKALYGLKQAPRGWFER